MSSTPHPRFAAGPTSLVENRQRKGLTIGLAASVCGFAGVSALIASTLVPSSAKPILYLLIAVAMLAILIKNSHYLLLAMLAFGPLYDIVRAMYFPNLALVGAWQDLIVAAITLTSVRNLLRRNFRWRLTKTDIAVMTYVGMYVICALWTYNLAVWFYESRWYLLYAVLYLVLKTHHFKEREFNLFLKASTAGLLISAGVGFWWMVKLGPVRYMQAWWILGFTVLSRGGRFRWPATFASPLVASSAFGLLMIIAVAFLLKGKRRWTWAIVFLIGLFACASTLSRSGLAVGVGGCIAMLSVADEKSAQFWRRIAPFVALIAVGLVFIAVFIPGISQTLGFLGGDDDVRLKSFETVLVESITHPFGFGLGTAGASSINAAEFAGIRTKIDPAIGDSVLLGSLRDAGWIAFLAFLTVCLGFMSTARKAIRNARTPDAVVAALVAFGFSAGMLLNLMDNADVFPLKFYFWFFGALALALADGRVSDEKAADSGVERISA